MYSILKKILVGKFFLMLLAALSTLIVSSKLGPANFGFVASVIAISSLFSTSLIGPITTLILREPVLSTSKNAISILKMYVISCFIYILFLFILFLIGDQRITEPEALVYLIVILFAGFNSLVASFFFGQSQIGKVNLHSIIPEALFLIIILCFKEFTIGNVLIAWILQALSAIALVTYRRKILFARVFKLHFHKFDFVSSIVLGFQNLIRDRAILIISPLLFSLSEIGKLAFYLMIIKVFISLNGSLANLIISKRDDFNKDSSLLKKWIYLLFLTTLLFFIFIFLFNKTNILMEYHINLFQIFSISLTLFFSFLFSLQLNNIYANYQLKPFAIFQTFTSLLLLILVFVYKDYFDIFFFNTFIVFSMCLSIFIYNLLSKEKKLKKT